MATREIPVPDIGDFKNIPVIEIFVKPGDVVAKDAPLVTLESDKATVEVPSPGPGTIKELKVKIGDRVSQGSVILVMEVAEGAARPRAQDRERGTERTGSAGPGRGSHARTVGHAHACTPPAHAAGGGSAGRGAGDGRREAPRRELPRRGAGAGLRSRRLHRRVSGRRSRQEGGSRRALPAYRRRLPERRLHSVQGAAARREGDHRRRRRAPTSGCRSGSPRSTSTGCASSRTGW